MTEKTKNIKIESVKITLYKSEVLFLRKLASKKLPKLYREYRKLLDREKQIENGYKFKERKYNDPEFRAVRNRIQNIMKKRMAWDSILEQIPEGMEYGFIPEDQFYKFDLEKFVE